MMVTKLGGGPVVNWAYFAIKKAPEEIKQRPIFMRAIFIWIYCRGLGDDLEILLEEVLGKFIHIDNFYDFNLKYIWFVLLRWLLCERRIHITTTQFNRHLGFGGQIENPQTAIECVSCM